MKRFYGVTPFSYETIFGIIKIEEIQESNNRYFVARQITDTSIKLPTRYNPDFIVAGRKFPTRLKCIRYIQDIEKTTIVAVNDLIKSHIKE